MTVHQFPISVNGWQGSGYSVLDPETGVGAYQISGGASGGILIAAGALLLAIWVATIGFSVIAAIASGGASLLVLTPLILKSAAVVLGAVGMIARGLEILLHDTDDAAVACGVFQASVSSLVAVLLALVKVAELAAIATGIALNFGIGSIARCLR